MFREKQILYIVDVFFESFTFLSHELEKASQEALVVKNLPANAGDEDLILGEEDTLEEGVATHSSILAWTVPWTEKPGGLQSTGFQRTRHD